jgi:hypothetical protein
MNKIGVGIALQIGYRLDGQGSITGRGTIFLLTTESRPALGLTQPSIYRGLCPWE